MAHREICRGQSLYDMIGRLESLEKSKEAVVTTNCSAPAGKTSKAVKKFVQSKKESLEGLATGCISGLTSGLLADALGVYDSPQLRDEFFLFYYLSASVVVMLGFKVGLPEKSFNYLLPLGAGAGAGGIAGYFLATRF